MKVVEVNSSEFPKILEEIDGDTKMISLFNTLKMVDRLLGVEFKLFVVQKEAFRHYLVQQITLKTKLTICHVCNTEDAEFVRASTNVILAHFQHLFDKFEGFMSIATREDIRKVANEYFETINSHPFITMDEPNWLFYLDDNQIERLMNTALKLPEGYEFSSLSASDALDVSNDQLWTSKGDEKFIELKITGLPSVCIIHKATGGLASYLLHDGFGMTSLLYTKKEHRHKGLAALVEKRLDQRDYEELGHRPFKGVSINRPRVIEMSKKNYQVVKNSKGIEEKYNWLYRSKLSKPRIVIYEN